MNTYEPDYCTPGHNSSFAPREPKDAPLWWGGTFSGEVTKEMIGDWVFETNGKLRLPGDKKHDTIVQGMVSGLGDCIHEIGLMEIEADGSGVYFSLQLSESDYNFPRWRISIDGLVEQWIDNMASWPGQTKKTCFTDEAIPARAAIRAQLVRAIELLDAIPDGERSTEGATT